MLKLRWAESNYGFGLNIDHTAIAMPLTHKFDQNTNQFVEIWTDGGIETDMGTHVMYFPMSEIQKSEFVLQKKKK